MSRFVIITIGYLYPAYLHLKDIKHGSVDEDQFYVHWITMAVFSFVENILDLLMYWYIYDLTKASILLRCKNIISPVHISSSDKRKQIFVSVVYISTVYKT